MVTLHFRSTFPALLVVGALAASTLTGPASAHQRAAEVRLFTPDRNPVMTIHNSGADEWVEFNPALYLESPRHRFEIDVRRRSADRPITATVQVGDRTRKLKTSLLAGWSGLKNAFTLTWLTPSGTLISRSRTSWCPNDGTESRLGPHAETSTNFVYGCTTNPFTRGERWGIDRGWSRQVLPFQIIPPTDRLGTGAVLEISLRSALGSAFGIPAAERTVRYRVTVKHVTDPVDPGPGPGPAPAASRRADRSEPSATSSGQLSRSLLPDLVALPAWQIATHVEDGHDLLDFAATVYNGGPGPLVAEGFRRGSSTVMSAYQFFYRGTQQVAERKVGTMVYDARPSHQHWHFKDFATYDLVNSRHQRQGGFLPGSDRRHRPAPAWCGGESR